MKGKLLTLTEAEIVIQKDELNPYLGCFKVIIKLKEPECHEKMINKELDFSLTIPCMQFCGRVKTCSKRHEKVCEEATVTILKNSIYWKLNKEIYSSQSGLDTDEPGMYS